MKCERCDGDYKPGILDEVPLCKICEMLVSAAPPRIKTEATFQAKGNLGGSQFHPKIREHYLNAAREAGVTTDGRTYEPRLAAFPGDPEAWVSGPDDVKRVVESRGWSMDGDIKVKGREVAPVKGPVIADDLLEDLVEKRLEERLGEDFVEASGGVVERAIADVMNTNALPAHLAK